MVQVPTHTYLPACLPTYSRTDRQTCAYTRIHIILCIEESLKASQTLEYKGPLSPNTNVCDILRLAPSTIYLSPNPEALNPTTLKVSNPKP